MAGAATPENIAQFASLTGESPERATFFLESATTLEEAVGVFFETGGQGLQASEELEGAADYEDDDDDDEMGDSAAVAAAAQVRSSAPPPSSIPQSGGRTLGGEGTESTFVPGPFAQGGGSGSSSRETSRPTSRLGSGGPRVTGFRDLAAAAGPSAGGGPSRGGGGGPRVGRLSHNDDSDDEDGPPKDPQEFFAGGGKSGLSVENPNAKKPGAGNLVKDLLKKAQEGGVAPAPGSSNPRPAGSFRGGGHTLGSDDTPSIVVGGGSSVPGSFPSSAGGDDDEEEEGVVRNLTFWRNGFSVDDGELMGYEDPANQDILAALNAGRAPLSLLNVTHGQPVELRVAKRLNEDWVAPPPKPFSGSGNRLGSEASPAPASPAPAAQAAPPTRAEPSTVLFELDQSQPVTQVQIRLRSGERLVGRFNHGHTVGDLRNYINASSPGQAAVNYVLQTTFPSRDLTDDAMTIKEAGLLGSVVVQRGL